MQVEDLESGSIAEPFHGNDERHTNECEAEQWTKKRRVLSFETGPCLGEARTVKKCDGWVHYHRPATDLAFNAPQETPHYPCSQLSDQRMGVDGTADLAEPRVTGGNQSDAIVLAQWDSTSLKTEL